MRFHSAPRTSMLLAATAAFGTLALIGPTPTVHAQTTHGPGSGGALIDATSSGNGNFISDIVVIAPATEIIQSFNSVTLTGLTHSWIGDLEILLTNVESGAEVALTSPPDDSEADFNGTYTFLVDPSLQTVDEATSGLASDAVVRPGVYAISSFGGGTDNGSHENFGAFVGLGIGGTWRLSITDFVVEDSGTLSSWQFNATTRNITTAAPEPGSLALAGILLPGMVMIARRRRVAK